MPLEEALARLPSELDTAGQAAGKLRSLEAACDQLPTDAAREDVPSLCRSAEELSSAVHHGSRRETPTLQREGSHHHSDKRICLHAEANMCGISWGKSPCRCQHVGPELFIFAAKFSMWR